MPGQLASNKQQRSSGRHEIASTVPQNDRAFKQNRQFLIERHTHQLLLKTSTPDCRISTSVAGF
ncbi:MAG TPA: hypothetical protein VL461_06285 [Dictyobacter sp.]|nr:hypothetical protein [Dictyobacter sp.]